MKRCFLLFFTRILPFLFSKKNSLNEIPLDNCTYYLYNRTTHLRRGHTYAFLITTFCLDFLRLREGNNSMRVPPTTSRSSGREIGCTIYGDLGRLRYADNLEICVSLNIANLKASFIAETHVTKCTLK